MINIKNLCFQYQKNTCLDNVNCNIEYGKITTLLGSSGSGKSTLLRCIAQLEKINNGSITFSKFDKSYSIKTAVVFQHFYLFHNMNVLENLLYAQINVLKLNKKNAQSNALKWLNAVGMIDFKDAMPKEISGGQAQRVAIARALCMNPAIILMDEPTSALDPNNVARIASIMKDLKKSGVTVLIATHALGFAKNIADNVLLFNHGKIVEQSTAEDFFLYPKTKEAKIFLENF